MKNEFQVKFGTSEQFIGDLPVNVIEQKRYNKKISGLDAVTPTIIVCRPMEGNTEIIPSVCGGRLLKILKGRILQRETAVESDDNSSSRESMSGETNWTKRSSSSTSESSSDDSERQHSHRSIISLRRVFQSLNLTSRSQSCPAQPSRQPKKQKQPKCILRPPITYTYVRGLSGLPTQRVPRYACCDSSARNR